MGKSSYEKSPHIKQSTPEERKNAFKRAIRTLRGSSVPVSLYNVAERAASYVHEGYQTLLRELKGYSETELKDIGFHHSQPAPQLKTRPVRSGDWALSGNRRVLPR